MFISHVDFLLCPVCGASGLALENFDESGGGSAEEVVTGCAVCRSCRRWWPLDQGVLFFLTSDLAYTDHLLDFASRNKAHLEARKLEVALDAPKGDEVSLQRVQQKHSDWFQSNETVSYTDFADTAFWRSVDSLVLERWAGVFPAAGAVLELGCGQGRFTKYLYDRPLDVVALDVSMNLVLEASAEYERRRRSGDAAAHASFLVSDASALSMADGRFDAVMVYGVLHHLPDPAETCMEIARVLKAGGLYLGSENNVSLLRCIFDLLQRAFPLWVEEAGPEAQISKTSLQAWLGSAGMDIQSYAHVYLPPHLVNLFPDACARFLLRLTDRLGGVLPVVRDNGGLISFQSRKR